MQYTKVFSKVNITPYKTCLNLIIKTIHCCSFVILLLSFTILFLLCLLVTSSIFSFILRNLSKLSQKIPSWTFDRVLNTPLDVCFIKRLQLVFESIPGWLITYLNHVGLSTQHDTKLHSKFVMLLWTHPPFTYSNPITKTTKRCMQYALS